MKFPPFSAPLNFISGLSPKNKSSALWLIFSGDQLLISEDKTRLPDYPPINLKRELSVGTLEDTDIYAGETEPATPAPAGWTWCSLRSLYLHLTEPHYALAGRAFQLLTWDRTHTYCGCCGHQTFVRNQERCRECPSCGHLAYPKIAPAVMALISKGEQILLANSPHFPEKFYSVIAGFVDPGETLEQSVAREVMEEVGLKVKNVHYFGSQSWPFPCSLMLAFKCDWDSGEIRIDPSEISHADWFHRDNLPQLPPKLSISRLLIDSYLGIIN